jgi:pimeloyl-ACP methyl ester carboxylesterase
MSRSAIGAESSTDRRFIPADIPPRPTEERITRSSWYLVATEDRMIPPDAQRAMSKRAGATVTEVRGSHAVYVSQPDAVAALIAKAAHGVTLATR